MRIDSPGPIVILVIGVTTASLGGSLLAQQRGSAQRDRVAIEKLHQQDIDATLSDKADELAKLWDRDAVRLGQGAAAEVGQAVIYADDQRWEAKNTGRTLSYKPDIKDVQVGSLSLSLPKTSR
jgi:hypothetical protein